MVPYGALWCLVVPCGALWCLVVPCGALWCLVVPCGVLWCLVVPYGALWCLVVPCGVLIVFICSSVYSANLAQDKNPRRAIFIKVMVQTAQQKAALRTKKALENGKTSFKPRGDVNRALFEIMKKEFDKKAEEINGHTSSVGDRIIKEISPLVALFSGGDSTNPQDRVNARLLQNAANNKTNKADRELIKQQKAIAKAKAKGKAKASQENEQVQKEEEMQVDEDFMHQHKIQIEELPEEQETQKKKIEEDSSDSDATTTPPSERTSSESLEISSNEDVENGALINELIDMV